MGLEDIQEHMRVVRSGCVWLWWIWWGLCCVSFYVSVAYGGAQAACRSVSAAYDGAYVLCFCRLWWCVCFMFLLLVVVLMLLLCMLMLLLMLVLLFLLPLLLVLLFCLALVHVIPYAQTLPTSLLRLLPCLFLPLLTRCVVCFCDGLCACAPVD